MRQRNEERLLIKEIPGNVTLADIQQFQDFINRKMEVVKLAVDSGVRVEFGAVFNLAIVENQNAIAIKGITLGRASLQAIATFKLVEHL